MTIGLGRGLSALWLLGRLGRGGVPLGRAGSGLPAVGTGRAGGLSCCAARPVAAGPRLAVSLGPRAGAGEEVLLIELTSSSPISSSSSESSAESSVWTGRTAGKTRGAPAVGRSGTGELEAPRTAGAAVAAPPGRGRPASGGTPHPAARPAGSAWRVCMSEFINHGRYRPSLGLCPCRVTKRTRQDKHHGPWLTSHLKSAILGGV